MWLYLGHHAQLHQPEQSTTIADGVSLMELCARRCLQQAVRWPELSG